MKGSEAPPQGPGEAPLSEADRALFRHAMRGVQPLHLHGAPARVRPPRHLPEAVLRERRARAEGPAPAAHREPPPQLATRLPEGMHDPHAVEFLQPGCGRDLLRGLRRGKWVPQATLDLHGATLAQARERLDRFLASCAQTGVRCVRVVHGKGLGSQGGGPVLKHAMRAQLTTRALVQAWVQCDEAAGGSGAVHALLRSTRAASGR